MWDVTRLVEGANTHCRRIIKARVLKKHLVSDDLEVTFEERLFWPFPWVRFTARGSCTVWHCVRTGRRMGTLREGWLSSIAVLVRMLRDD